jgi:diketogulonate reductase-like aldo/keto reductase
MTMSETASVTSPEIPCLTLRNGVTIPRIGHGCAFGDWLGRSDFQGFLPEMAWRSIHLALEAGYRHFDTAHVYGTERHLGDLLGRCFADDTLRRDDVFLTTKLAHPAAPPHVALSHRLSWDWKAEPDLRQRILDDFDRSKEKVGVGYFDLILMHWPGPFDNQDAGFGREARAAIWSAFEELHARGEARAIGVSNFTRRHLEPLLEAASVAPMVNQIELHPYCHDAELVAFSKEQGMVVEAYAPFASGGLGLLDDPVVNEIANKVERSTGQVILRWHIQHDHIVLPKSSSARRLADNLAVFDFELDDDSMAGLDALGTGPARRTCPDPADIQ